MSANNDRKLPVWEKKITADGLLSPVPPAQLVEIAEIMVEGYNAAIARSEVADPMHVDPQIYVALRHFQSGEHGQAEAICRDLLQKKPQEADAWHILGLIARQAGRHEQAVDLIARAALLNPQAAIFRVNFAGALHQLGRCQEAVAQYKAAITLQPDHATAHHDYGLCLQGQGLAGEAMSEYRRAISLDPRNARAHLNLGTILKSQGSLAEALNCFQRAIAIKPDFVPAYYNHGVTLQALGRLDEAIESYGRAMALEPGHALSHSNTAVALQAQGRMEEAFVHYELALKHKPDYHDAHSNMLLALNYAAGHDPREIYTRHLAWAERHAKRFYPAAPKHPNIPDAGRRLRVGYVSPDYRRHAVAYFIDPVLGCHDQERVDVFCYANVARPDEITDGLQRHAVHWRDIYGQPDEQVEAMVRADGIDILVDLAGHSANGRLLLFARKPAPVQFSWLGYLATTGLATIDYRVLDYHTAPPGLCDPYYTETIIRLPDTFVCFRPPPEAPAVGPLPAPEAGFVTFGSFNNFAKVTPEVMHLWSQVLRAAPGSRLMLKADGLNDASVQRRTVDFFSSRGIGPERLTLLGRDPGFDMHFSRYHQVDIGLDPFPCNGGTTSCDSMWMGVPVVSLAGDTFISRMGVSMLTNVGLTELIADTREDYVRIAARLAGDLDHLRGLRAGLRERMRSSPLMDAPAFTRNLEHAYRETWARWCSQNARD